MINIFSPEVPVLLIGAPGIGKTAGVQAHFEHAEILLTSTLVEEDIAGLPYRDGEYDYRTVPAIFRRLAEASKSGKTTVLFFDELDKARRSVADTLLTLVASRRVGNASLPIDTCIVAAANPPEFGGGDGISEAMQSRFSTVYYEPDVSAWCGWAKSQFTSLTAASVVSAIGSGEMPIFDMTGEGLERRISCPRTIAMALHVLDKFGCENSLSEKLVRGMLTPAVSSQIMHLVKSKENDVLHAASAAAKRSAINKHDFKPVRL